jgi:hypothetical protein
LGRLPTSFGGFSAPYPVIGYTGIPGGNHAST